MAKILDYSDVNSYATRANAVKAFEAKYGKTELRFVVVANENGRFSPVAIGQEAVQAGVHFNFPVVG